MATTKRRYAGGYYGTRNADFFPQLFIERAGAGAAFSDITAGTGQFPYRMAQRYRKPVVLLERCPYVGYLLRAVFEGEVNQSHVARTGKLPAGYATEGYLLGREDLVGRIFSKKMASRVDFLAKHGQFHKDSALLHALGRALNYFTFRSLNWCVSQAKGTLSVDVEVAVLERHILRVLDDMRYFHGLLDGAVVKGSSVFIGDSVKLLPRVGRSGALHDAVVYADPAWPWAGSATSKAGNDNPYAFAYEELSSILEQKQLRIEGIWRRSDEERIKSETLGWIRDSFAAGARQFISCTQDTNFPHPDVVRQWFIDEGLKVPHTMELHDYSASANREYLNYWFFINA